MFVGGIFLLVGIMSLVALSDYKNNNEIDLRIMDFWKSFKEQYPEKLIDKIHQVGGRNMEFFYKLTNTNAYKKLSKEESKGLVADLTYIDKLNKDWESREKEKRELIYVAAGSIGIFIFISLFNYFN